MDSGRSYHVQHGTVKTAAQHWWEVRAKVTTLEVPYTAALVVQMVSKKAIAVIATRAPIHSIVRESVEAFN